MDKKIQPLTWVDLLLLFGLPTILNFIACKIAIPFLDAQRVFPIEVTYFICVGLIVLIPMFFGAIFLTIKEIKSFKIVDIFNRLRIKRLSQKDMLWTVGGFIFLSLVSFLIAKILLPFVGIDSTPFFFKNMPLNDNYLWVLYVWPVFFFFNIFGEEFLWRGYIQPRQEYLNKKYTWLVHGVLWAFWHLPMGLDLIFAALPIFFILPAIVQIRKNTSIAIVIHFVFGAFGFLSLSLGLLH